MLGFRGGEVFFLQVKGLFTLEGLWAWRTGCSRSYESLIFTANFA